MSEHEERIGKALRSARAGNVEVALHILRPLLREEEIRPHAYLALAYCHEQSGESQKALYLYTCAVSAAPDPVIAAAWKQRLEECRDYVWSQAEHKSPVSPRPRLARSALRMFIACFLLCVGFATFLIPVLVDRLFGVILAEGLILAISSLLGLLAIILLALYVFTQIVRYRHYRYRRECVTPSFETSKENCPACKLQFDGPICPWCRFEKDFENAQRLAAEGNYSGAITSVKMTKDLGDQFYQEKVTSTLVDWSARLANLREDAEFESAVEAANSFIIAGHLHAARNRLRPYESHERYSIRAASLLQQIDHAISNRNQAMQPSDKQASNSHVWLLLTGSVALFIGILWGIAAINLEIGVDGFSNLSLMHNRLVHIICSGTAIICGVLFTCFGVVVRTNARTSGQRKSGT